MSFANHSNRQRTIDNAALIATKQNLITASTDLTCKSLTGLSVHGNALTYTKSGLTINVMTEVDKLTSKLDGATTILTSSGTDYTLSQLLQTAVDNKAKLSTFTDALNGALGDEDSNVISLMEQVSQNKLDISNTNAALSTADTAVQTALGAIETSIINLETNVHTYTDTAVATLETTVTQNKTTYDARVLAVDSQLTTLSNSVGGLDTYTQSIAGARFETLVLEGELIVNNGEIETLPYLSVGTLDVSEARFGIPMTTSKELLSAAFICKIPTASGTISPTSSMTYSFVVRDSSGTAIETVSKAFIGGRSTVAMSMTLPDDSSLEVSYVSRIGDIVDHRVRIALLFRCTDLDNL